jgi:hypothetical protein
MVEGLSTISYKGKTIIYINYTDLGKSKEKTIQLLIGATEEYRKYPLKSVLALTNTTNLAFNMDVLKIFKDEGKKTAPYEKKVAAIGVKGLLKAAYNFVVGLTSKTFKVFDTELEAKEWLVSD